MALFPDMTKEEHHICRASVGCVATLAIREVFLSNGWYESVEHSIGQYFARGEQGDSSVIGEIRLSIRFRV